MRSCLNESVRAARGRVAMHAVRAIKAKTGRSGSFRPPTTDIFVVKCTGRGLVVKRPGVLSKVQMLNLVLGVGVFSLLSIQKVPQSPIPRKIKSNEKITKK